MANDKQRKSAKPTSSARGDYSRETIVDREAFDHGVFAANGGFDRINKTFEGRLETVVADLHDRIWLDVAV
jgi:hypothetical protein